LLAALIRIGLPRSKPTLKLSWPSLIHSSAMLIRTQPVLREAALLSAMLFCAFSAFWTTLVFFLETPPYHYGSAVAGVVLLDIGVQAGHVSNQTRIYGLLPEARSRLNMVYMICYFTAGAMGSFAGSVLWHHFAWLGVCGFGCFVTLAGCAVYVFARPRR
jgi:predicted MFS family arabinose efflux permease